MASMPKMLSWRPYDSWKGWLRGFAISLAGAGFLAFAGAFGSDRAGSPVIRFAYWLGLMTAGWLTGIVISGLFFGAQRHPTRLWLRVVCASLALGLPYSLVVGWVSRFAFHATYRNPLDAVSLVASVLLVTLVMVTINVLVARHGEAITQASSVPAKFLDRLPAKLRGAEVWAVEAEDHYLRLHTSRGQDLILMRLSDAVAELEGIEGAQVHRSWWVARAAITEAVRGDGRATLTLKDGAEVPVSRTYARLLRERDWI